LSTIADIQPWSIARLVDVRHALHFRVMNSDDQPNDLPTSRFGAITAWAKEWMQARLLLLAPLLITIIVGRLFGEGSYLLLIVGTLYAILFAYNSRRHADASSGSFREDQAVNVGCWSAMIAILSFGMAFLMFGIGAWE
jgi:hypothetical protein